MFRGLAIQKWIDFYVFYNSIWLCVSMVDNFEVGRKSWAIGFDTVKRKGNQRKFQSDFIMELSPWLVCCIMLVSVIDTNRKWGRTSWKPQHCVSSHSKLIRTVFGAEIDWQFQFGSKIRSSLFSYMIVFYHWKFQKKKLLAKLHGSFLNSFHTSSCFK